MPDNKAPARNKLPAKVRPRWSRLHTGTLFIIVGVAAIAAAAAIWLYNEYDNKRAAETAQNTVESILEIIRSNDPSNTETGNAGSGAAANAPGASVPGSDTQIVETPGAAEGSGGGSSYVVVQNEAYIGILSIPRFSLNLPVNLTWSYPKLRMSPCRFSGDIANNDLVIAAHSYRSHFGNINSLAPGDDITFIDTSGREYNYYVAAVETVQPSDTRVVVSSRYDLTLFTCTYDSRARVVVRCFKVPEPEPEPVSEPEPEASGENEVPAVPPAEPEPEPAPEPEPPPETA